MSKVIVEYNESNGELTDAKGMVVGNWMGLDSFPEQEPETGLRDLIKLKDAGFTADDIVAMKEGGVL